MKEFIGGLFALLAFIVLVLLVFGFFNPRWALFWYNRPRTKRASILIYGLTTIVAFGLTVAILPSPPPAGKAAPNKDASTQSAEANPAARVSKAPAPASEPPMNYQIAHELPEGTGIYLKIIIDEVHSRDSIIELTRRLREQYHAKGIFSCYYYYKKYTKTMTAIAGAIYLEDCSTCAYKDKDGTPIDFPCYKIEKSTYDLLKPLHFDTTGFAVAATYIEPMASTKHYILSSPGRGALLVIQDTTGAHEVYLLDKETIDGQERFVEALQKHRLYIIDRYAGLVDYYNFDELDSQRPIDQ